MTFYDTLVSALSARGMLRICELYAYTAEEFNCPEELRESYARGDFDFPIAVHGYDVEVSLIRNGSQIQYMTGTFFHSLAKLHFSPFRRKHQRLVKRSSEHGLFSNLEDCLDFLESYLCGIPVGLISAERVTYNSAIDLSETASIPLRAHLWAEPLWCKKT